MSRAGRAARTGLRAHGGGDTAVCARSVDAPCTVSCPGIGIAPATGDDCTRGAACCPEDEDLALATRGPAVGTVVMANSGMSLTHTDLHENCQKLGSGVLHIDTVCQVFQQESKLVCTRGNIPPGLEDALRKGKWTVHGVLEKVCAITTDNALRTRIRNAIEASNQLCKVSAIAKQTQGQRWRLCLHAGAPLVSYRQRTSSLNCALREVETGGLSVNNDLSLAVCHDVLKLSSPGDTCTGMSSRNAAKKRALEAHTEYSYSIIERNRRVRQQRSAELYAQYFSTNHEATDQLWDAFDASQEPNATGSQSPLSLPPPSEADSVSIGGCDSFDDDSDDDDEYHESWIASDEYPSSGEGELDH